MLDVARIEDGVVVERTAIPDGVEIADAFHPDLDFRLCDPAVQVGWVDDDGVLSAPPPPPPPTKGELLAYAAAKRWQVETGGITVAGALIDTGRESQSMITGAYAYSQANPAETISYKAASGWVTIDAATMAAIAAAVGAHVQAAFAAEAAVAAEIEAETITTTAEIDAADWPV